MRKLALGILACMGLVALASPPSDDHIRRQVVKLSSERGQCTGEQIIAPSGKTYILSAAHCIGIASNGVMRIFTEDGRMDFVRVIAEDHVSDLLLMEGTKGLPGLHIAPIIKKHQRLRTFTHGHGMDTYKTEGEVVQEGTFEAPLFSIGNISDLTRCKSQPKFHVEMGFFDLQCVMSVKETITTASVVPGSSGGPMVDESGRLLGVCTGTSEIFSYWVTLKDIQAFLAKY